MSANLTLTAVDDLNGDMFGDLAQTGTASASVDFVFDTFTDTNDTVLSSHTGETGATWTLHTSYTATIIIRSNNAHKDGSASSSAYYASGTPPGTDYTVKGALVDLTNDNRSSAICGWIDTATNTMVGARRQNSTAMEFFKLINGTFTSIDTEAVTYTQDQVRELKITRSGTTFEWFLDDVSLGQHTISDTELSGAGKVGVRQTGAWPLNSTYPITYIRAY